MERLILKVHGLLARLKELRRTGWVERGVREPESVAAHSYAVALLSVLLADIRGLDAASAARMALLHDLPEAVTGDLTPEAKHRLGEEAEARERMVLEELAKLMSPRVSELWLRDWKRYQRGEDEVARLVREVDKLEMGLQAAEYASRYGREMLRDIYDSAQEAVSDQRLLKALKAAWHKRPSLL